MRIVAAGASGLIGRRLTASLLRSGHEVIALTTRRVESDRTHEPGLRQVSWDGATAGEWTRHIQNADAVINLSGQSLASARWTNERKNRLIQSRVLSTRILVTTMCSVQTKPAVFLNASAVGYYGPVETGEVAEDHPPGSDFLARLCVKWEEEAMAASKAGIRTVLLRTGVVLDTEGGALQRLVLPFRLFVGGPLGAGTQWMPWIHREDLAEAMLFTLEQNDISGPVNLTAPGCVTMNEFNKTLARVLRRPAILRVPAVVLRMVLGEMATVVLTGQRAIPRALTAAGFRFKYPALEEALVDLLKLHAR